MLVYSGVRDASGMAAPWILLYILLVASAMEQIDMILVNLPYWNSESSVAFNDCFSPPKHGAASWTLQAVTSYCKVGPGRVPS